MKEHIAKLSNEQINAELYSAYLYLAFADYYEEEGLSGYAHYFEVQAAEERDHALIFRKYLHENGEKVTLTAIEEPSVELKSHIDPLEEALAHEKKVTDLINTIYAAAQKENDFRTMSFLNWFIDEQMEEEDEADRMISRMKLFGNDAHALYELDAECGARTYAPPAALEQD